MTRPETTLTAPAEYLAAALQWATDDRESPPPQLVQTLNAAPRPIITDPAAVRESLWKLIAAHNYVRGLEWLNETGLLPEIFPCWSRDPDHRRLRLTAVNEIRRGRWTLGLSEEAHSRIRAAHEQTIDGGLTGWGLTNLATLLLTGDESSETHAGLVLEDLVRLGATPAEVEWITTAVREYPPLMQCFLTGIIPHASFHPATIIGTLASLFSDFRAPEDIRTSAVLVAGDIILGV